MFTDIVDFVWNLATKCLNLVTSDYSGIPNIIDRDLSQSGIPDLSYLNSTSQQQTSASASALSGLPDLSGLNMNSRNSGEVNQEAWEDLDERLSYLKRD